MAKKKEYVGIYSRLQIAVLATFFDKSFFTVVDWIKADKPILTSKPAEEALSKVESLDNYFYETQQV